MPQRDRKQQRPTPHQMTTFTSLPGTTIDPLDRLPRDELLNIGVGQRCALDRAVVGRGRHANRAAQLAVDLHDEFDLVLLQRRRDRAAATAHR